MIKVVSFPFFTNSQPKDFSTLLPSGTMKDMTLIDPFLLFVSTHLSLFFTSSLFFSLSSFLIGGQEHVRFFLYERHESSIVPSPVSPLFLRRILIRENNEESGLSPLLPQYFSSFYPFFLRGAPPAEKMQRTISLSPFLFLWVFEGGNEKSFSTFSSPFSYL